MELYDVKDKSYRNYIRGLALANKPIKFYTKYINYLTVEEVLSIGEETYKKILMPFMLTKDYMFDGNAPEKINTLDILTDTGNDNLCDDLITCIGLSLNVDLDDIEIVSIDNEHREILIKNKKDIYDNLYIDSNKFEQLRSIVLFVNNMRELRKTDKTKNKLNSTNEYNERLAVFYKGKEEHDKIKGEDSSNEILNLFDFLVHTQSNLDYEKILKLNMYQFNTSVKRYSQKEDIKFSRDLYSSGQIDLKGVEIPKFYKIISDDNR